MDRDHRGKRREERRNKLSTRALGSDNIFHNYGSSKLAETFIIMHLFYFVFKWVLYESIIPLQFSGVLFTHASAKNSLNYSVSYVKEL